VISSNAYVPGKPSSGTGGWVPPKPGSNNTANSNGGGGGFGGALTSKQQGFRVVGSARPAASSLSGEAIRRAAQLRASSRIERQAALDAIRRAKSGKTSGGSTLAGVSDKN